MRKTIVAAALLWVVHPLTGQPAGTVLENSRLRLVFDGTRGGALASFVDKRTGRDWIAKDAPATLYSLTLRQTDGATLRTDEKQAVAPVVKVTREGRAQVLRIVADKHEKQPLGVRIACTLPDDAAQVSCRIHVTNRSPLPLSSVRFPSLAMPLRLGVSSDDDRLLIPTCDGNVIENPEKNIDDRHGFRAAYPGTASLQLFAFYDGGGGFEASVQDTAGYAKEIGGLRIGKMLNFAVNHLPDEAPREEIEIPYPVVMGTFEGDWQTAADHYRDWARKQPWAAVPLLHSKTQPAWLMHPPFVFTFGLGIQTADGRNLYRENLLPQYFSDYAKALDAPVWAVLTGWEKNGTWITPDYFPPRGGNDAFKGLTGSLREKGYRSGYFLSGLRWTLQKTNPRYTNAPYDSREEFAREGERYAVVGENGKVVLTGTPETDVGMYAELCIGTRYTQDLILSQVLRSLEVGVASVQLDQAVGGGTPRCYSKTHGHPPGGGNWAAKALFALFQRIREEGRRRNPEFAFLIEEPGEFFIPVIDCYHGRDYAEGRWPRHGNGVRGVPLFAHVYHAYLLGNGGDSAGITKTANIQNVYSAAMNLVAGKVPGAALWTGEELRAEAIDSAQRKVLTGSFRLMKTAAREYLLMGERMATPPLDVPPVTIPIPIQKGTKWELDRRQYPGVLYSGWTLPGGKLGFVFVNLSNAAVGFDFPLRVPATSRYRVQRSDATGTAMLPGSQPLRLELPSYEPVFLEALPVKR